MKLSATSSCAITADVLRSAVLAAVVVVVTEIPRRTGSDVVTASPALDVASSHERRPSCALSLVLGTVPPLLPRPSSLVLRPRVGGAARGVCQLGAARLSADLHAALALLRAWYARDQAAMQVEHPRDVRLPRVTTVSYS